MNLRELNAEHTELKRIKAAEEANIEELRTLLESGSKEQMIEKAARERLGYVYADEEIYVDISGN
jgi:cell division protein FtsB